MANVIGAKKNKDLPMSESVAGLVTRFSRVEQFFSHCTSNAHENFRFYWGLYAHLGLGQWPSSHIPKMIQSGRQLTQYNVILPIIDALKSAILKTPVEPKFLPLDQVAKGLVKIAKHMYYTDRELMDWDQVFREMVLHGLVFEGIVKMEIKDTYDPLGNIAPENCPQGSVFFDPFWKSGRRKDLKKAYKKSWASASDIANTYHLERAKLEARMNEMHGEVYGNFTGPNPYDVGADQWGSMHQIYEEYYMYPKTEKVEVIVGPDGPVEMPDIPDEDKPAFLDQFLPGWDKESIYEETYTTEECRLRTACPTLAGERLLVDGDPIEVQIGSPPFFVWAANRLNGQSRGMVDSLKDPQTNKNFLEAEYIRKIQSEGGGGGKFVDKSLLDGPKEVEKMERKSNRPDIKIYVKPGTFRKGLKPSMAIESTGIPSTIVDNIRHIDRDVVPMVGKRPPVSLGQADPGTDPSGKLFGMMSQNADEQMEDMVVSYRLFQNDWAEAYLLQGGQTYSNEMVPREFTYKGETMVANEVAEYSRGAFIRNDIRGLMKTRIKVIIDQQMASPTQRASTASKLLALSKAVPPENIGTRMIIHQEVMKNIREFDDETQKELEDMAKLEQSVAKMKLQLERATLEMQLNRVQGALNPEMGLPAQTGQPQGGEQPQEGGGPGYEIPADQQMQGEIVPPDESVVPQEGAPEPITNLEA